jgi:hypothetical protein
MRIKKVVMILSFSILFSGLVKTSGLFAQEMIEKSLHQKISCPEKWWAVGHFMIVGKAFRITQECQHITDSLSATERLGKDLQGGQLDAFKHAYWMASLTQKIKWRKAYRLGKAHEKGNYINFRKGAKQGIKSLPDHRSSEMDLWNNNAGIIIGKENRQLNRDQLQELIIDAILRGEMRVLNKDKEGNFLDCENQPIPRERLIGKWENPKCLVPSNAVSY